MIMEKRYSQPFKDMVHLGQEETLEVQIETGQTGSLFLSLDEGSQIKQIHIVLLSGSQCDLMVYHAHNAPAECTCQIEIQKDAKCQMGFLDMEEAAFDFDLKVTLCQEGAYFDLLSGQLGQSTYHKHNTIEVLHLAKHTTGLMRNFAVLFDDADYQMVATGNIQKGCKEAQSHQTTRVLTLGKDHKAKVIPLLLIDENDVKASHAQTIGQPDEDQLYYLQSRGLTNRQAMGLLSIGYLLPVLERIRDEDLKKELQQTMESKVGLYEDR